MTKRLVFIISILLTVSGYAQQGNPLLTNFDTPPFDKIETCHYMPAFEQGIAEARAEILDIANNPKKATFKNTIEAYEYSGALLTRVQEIFYNIAIAESSPELDKIDALLSPILTQYYNEVSMNSKLFARINDIYQRRNRLKLDDQQMMLLEKTYQSFVRGGALLDSAKKAKLCEIDLELSQLTTRYGQNVQNATNAFVVNVTDRSQVAELPPFVIGMAAGEARKRGLEGLAFTLQMPCYGPLMKYSTNRDLKEKMWRGQNTIAYGGDYDNSVIIKRITDLRCQYAHVLGYNNYSEYVLERTMAQTPQNVENFLGQLSEKSMPIAKSEYKSVCDFARSQGADYELMPWDWTYWADQYKRSLFSISDAEIKPYFALENARKGLFMLAEKLYGITFVENNNIPVYHPDVKAFEVYDGKRLMATLFMDFYPRDGKRSGAWMSNYRQQYVGKDGKDVRPIITMVANITKASDEVPSLLNVMEMTTLLHEFGHVLHGILSDVKYPSLSGTNVYRDFVELPSQFMENFLTQKQFLDMWAVHYKTGEKIPDELIAKMKRSKYFTSAYRGVRQLSLSSIDMAWHTIERPVDQDPVSFEKDALSSLQIGPIVDGVCNSTSFGHIFDGGYQCMYYSYKWAELLEADAFDKFEKNGIFNDDTARSFRDNILSKGGTAHPMTLYKSFSGHEPSIEPMLKRFMK